MATDKPRVNVTLEPSTYELLRRAAAAQHTSMSKVVAELVESVAPMFERLVSIADALEQAPEEIRATLRGASEAAEPAIMQQLGGASADFEQLLRFAEELGDRAREAGSDPRPVITGVTHE